jgi:hypothetical protein
MDTRTDLFGTIWVSVIGVALAGLFAFFKVRQVGDFGDWSWWGVAAPLVVIPVIVTIVALHHAAAHTRAA